MEKLVNSRALGARASACRFESDLRYQIYMIDTANYRFYIPSIEALVPLYGANVRLRGPYHWKTGNRILYDIFDGRKFTTVQAAKLILEVKLGRRLAEGETVDHIDEDCENDNPENLQILSLSENARKSALNSSNFNHIHAWMKTEDGKQSLSARASGTKNGMSKLTETDVQSMRSRVPYHGIIRDLMQEYDVSRSTIQSILKYKSYNA